MKYQLIVGNIGTVLETEDEPTASENYSAYVQISQSTHGRASGEQVTLMMNGEPIMEYIPLTTPE